MPAPYADPGYYVVYPRYHGLPPPSHGQRWVRVGADYLLVAIATGLIIDMVLHPH
ncbi:RcnB family protein [Kerstersia similis]|uniref:RcnB family protein n=1 Tax=Kerstersia similis TaxID=206505 RepID=UPI0039EFB877